MPPQPSPVPDSSDREILISRVVDAPRELVWQAMTDPAHVVHWWGPRGFTMTIEKMEVHPGGTWKHVLHGPDGTDYPNKCVFTEVVAPECVRFANSGGKQGAPGVRFDATWTFEAVDTGRTKVTIHMIFPSAEERDTVVKVYGAIEGAKQTLERLAEQLASASKPFIITRVFDAPRERVWQAWTQIEHLKQWFGPKGCTIPVCTLDLRPGGVFHYCMKTPDGREMWGRWVFREIIAPEKLVLISSFSDAQGGITRHPLSATWPRETLSKTTFTEHEGKTTLTLEWSAYNATEEERRTFDSSHDGMTQGWTGTMDQFAAYLAKP